MRRLRDHIEKLYPFLIVARESSVTRAAKKLGLSQAALSHSIKILEDTVGKRLLHRQSTGVSLTTAGEMLYRFSQRWFSDLDAVAIGLQHPEDPTCGKLRIATHETLAIHLWPRFLAEFSGKYPNIHLSLTGGRIDELVRGVLHGDYHLIVSIAPTARAELVIEKLAAGRLAFFAAPGGFPHRFPALRDDTLTRDEASAIPMLTDLSAHNEEGLPIPHLLWEHGLKSEFPFELNSFEAAIRLASAGLGIACLPEPPAREAVAGGHLREIRILGVSNRSFGRYQLCASYSAPRKGDGPISGALRTLIDELKGSPVFR